VRIINYRGKENIGLEFFTRSLPCFTSLYTLFYPKGKKVIPSNIYEFLTPVALAHLIMGDGSPASGGLRISTDSLTVQDVVKLSNVLIIRFGLVITLHKNGENYRIYISKKSMPFLISIVKPYMVKSMYYKLSI
jgi:hypothetical protein